MKRNIAIIILSLVIVLLITSFILTILIRKKNESKLTIENDEKIIELKYELENREKELQYLYDNPIIITKEILKNISSTEKDDIIIELKKQNNKQSEIIKKDTKIIQDLNNRLEITNNKLKNRYIPKHGFGIFGLAGIDQTLDIDLYVGATYKRYLLNGRFYIGSGIAIKPYKSIGGAITLELGFNF